MALHERSDISATCKGMTRARRPGATETIGVSLDRETKRKLKALAAERHGGNVSALITELTEHAARRAAFERAWQWYGGPEPTDEVRAKIDAELEAGRRAARKRVPKKARRKSAA